MIPVRQICDGVEADVVAGVIVLGGGVAKACDKVHIDTPFYGGFYGRLRISVSGVRWVRGRLRISVSGVRPFVDACMLPDGHKCPP